MGKARSRVLQDIWDALEAAEVCTTSRTVDLVPTEHLVFLRDVLRATVTLCELNDTVPAERQRLAVRQFVEALDRQERVEGG